MAHEDVNSAADMNAMVVAKPSWTRYDHKLFEEAVVKFPEGVYGRWKKIADAVPGKTVEQVKAQYKALVHDLEEINSGRVELPSFVEDDWDKSFLSWCGELSENQIVMEKKEPKHERMKQNRWTEEENRLFEIGIQKYGKGDWKSISRYLIKTKTPAQIASRAQTYFRQQNDEEKERKKMMAFNNLTTMTNTTPLLPSSTNLSSSQGGIPLMSDNNFSWGRGSFLPPPINFSSSEGGAFTPQPTKFSSSQGGTFQPPLTNLSDGHGREILSSQNFWGGEQGALMPLPTNFSAIQGVEFPPPSINFSTGQGGDFALPPTNFSGSQVGDFAPTASFSPPPTNLLSGHPGSFLPSPTNFTGAQKGTNLAATEEHSNHYTPTFPAARYESAL